MQSVVLNGMMASSEFSPVRPNFVRFVKSCQALSEIEEQIYPIWDSHTFHSLIPSIFRDKLPESHSNPLLLGKGIETTP